VGDGEGTRRSLKALDHEKGVIKDCGKFTKLQSTGSEKLQFRDLHQIEKSQGQVKGPEPSRRAGKGNKNAYRKTKTEQTLAHEEFPSQWCSDFCKSQKKGYQTPSGGIEQRREGKVSSELYRDRGASTSQN